MLRLLNFLKHTRTILHTVAILASAGASALAAVSLGGDPVIGAVIGAAANTAVALMPA